MSQRSVTALRGKPFGISSPDGLDWLRSMWPSLCARVGRHQFTDTGGGSAGNESSPANIALQALGAFGMNVGAFGTAADFASNYRSRKVSQDMRAGKPGQAPARHRLLPYERWLADYGARRGAAPQGSDRWRMQQNYGPEGMALLQVGTATGVLGWLIGMTGMVLLFISAGSSVIAQYVIGIGAFMILVGLVRIIQAGRAAGSIAMVGRLYAPEIADLTDIKVPSCGLARSPGRTTACRRTFA